MASLSNSTYLYTKSVDFMDNKRRQTGNKSVKSMYVMPIIAQGYLKIALRASLWCQMRKLAAVRGIYSHKTCGNRLTYRSFSPSGEGARRRQSHPFLQYQTDKLCNSATNMTNNTAYTQVDAPFTINLPCSLAIHWILLVENVIGWEAHKWPKNSITIRGN